MANAIKCGIIDLGNGVMPIVCVRDTGDLVVLDDLMGACYISEITVENPIEFASDESLLNKMNCKGVVVCGDGLYTFNETAYQFRAITDLSTSVLESPYDTSAEYEGPDLEWQTV